MFRSFLDNIFQQATSEMLGLANSSEFNLHCKIVVDGGHHTWYELQENKQCLSQEAVSQ